MRVESDRLSDLLGVARLIEWNRVWNKDWKWNRNLLGIFAGRRGEKRERGKSGDGMDGGHGEGGRQREEDRGRK